MKFYIASSFKNIDRVRYVSEKLKEKGYNILKEIYLVFILPRKALFKALFLVYFFCVPVSCR